PSPSPSAWSGFDVFGQSSQPWPIPLGTPSPSASVWPTLVKPFVKFGKLHRSRGAQLVLVFPKKPSNRHVLSLAGDTSTRTEPRKTSPPTMSTRSRLHPAGSNSANVGASVNVTRSGFALQMQSCDDG